MKLNAYKHGLSGSVFYNRWACMVTRGNKRYSNHKLYPVGLAKEWNKFNKFKEDMYDEFIKHSRIFGESNTSIDRIDNEKGYSKQNCRWVTKTQQAKNKKRVRIVCGDSLAQYCKKNNINYQTVISRLRRGWTLNDAISKKVNQKFRNNLYK